MSPLLMILLAVAIARGGADEMQPHQERSQPEAVFDGISVQSRSESGQAITSCKTISNLEIRVGGVYVFYYDGCFRPDDYTYTGSYNVRGYAGSLAADEYYVLYGDQECGYDKFSFTQYDYLQSWYNDKYYHFEEFGPWTSPYPSYFPKIMLYCSNSVFPCTFSGELCIVVTEQGRSEDGDYPPVGGGLSLGAIIGIVVGAVALLVIIVAVAIRISSRRKSSVVPSAGLDSGAHGSSAPYTALPN